MSCEVLELGDSLLSLSTLEIPVLPNHERGSRCQQVQLVLHRWIHLQRRPEKLGYAISPFTVLDPKSAL